MEISPSAKGLTVIPEFLSGGGEMGERIRNYDWRNTPLGPVETWPQNLRTCIRIMLTSRQPIWIGWGKDLIKFYNDPYKAIVGGKHPRALGAPAAVVWKDIWHDIEPMLRQVMEKDEGTYAESQLLIMERNGYPEETYYTFSYTPIPGDDGTTAGMICANTDDTDRIISERQLRTLTLLGKKITDARSETEVVEIAIQTLRQNPHDFPFALFYTFNNDNAVLTCSTDDIRSELFPQQVDMQHSRPDAGMGHLFANAIETKKMQVLNGLKAEAGSLPMGAWPASPEKAIILPILQASSREPYGFLVVGCNPYRLLDEKYGAFFSLIADQIATSFANVHVLKEERKRAEALAEIDRAKTIFFSNISHEFRTPLTLLLGPIEDALHAPGTIEQNKLRMEVAHRNALRMQKLVNTLLDFSRIEAGRMEGRFTRVDICKLTEELTSIFRSATEKAGIALQVNCDAIRDEVYVDPDMWEKIIMNLISNAFKYTKAGSITIDVKQHENDVQVAITDTGIGIPEDQVDKIFNRFHRVENTEGRSLEGTGIGLSLVRELVKLHGGKITVTSKPGSGTTFTVSIPTGKDHLPEDRIEKNDNDINIGIRHVSAYVQEAARWISDSDNKSTPFQPEQSNLQSPTRDKILLADDNADMRDYVYRLLSERFDVFTANDGEAAYEMALRERPDLIVSDIMMPKLDGFGLLARIRNHPHLKQIPLIFLSARAGEEAKVEGLDAGADDYLVKPFTAKELIARVTNHINIRKKIEEANTNLEKLVAERTKELQQSNQALQQFAHVASHDLKEPVRKIKTFTTRLEDEYSDTLPERAKGFVQKIQHATDRMIAMIDGVLRYSKIDSDQQLIEKIDLNQIFNNIEADLEILIQQKGATIRRNKLATIEGAAVLIYQLFYNIVNNSLKFSKLSEPPVISVSSSIENNGQLAVITVSDNGIGFEKEHAEKIFNTFTRLHSKDKYEGTGLGLALCKKIVERHHGQIMATGEKNKGAVFTIFLPVHQNNPKLL